MEAVKLLTEKFPLSTWSERPLSFHEEFMEVVGVISLVLATMNHFKLRTRLLFYCCYLFIEDFIADHIYNFLGFSEKIQDGMSHSK